uniref:Uncharacterized protein n=1 Tax=Cucumis melo TaxID=3656 RepID=A0A9I9DM96_CUCME
MVTYTIKTYLNTSLPFKPSVKTATSITKKAPKPKPFEKPSHMHSYRLESEFSQCPLKQSEIPVASTSELERRDEEDVFGELSDLNRTKARGAEEGVVNQPTP